MTRLLHNIRRLRQTSVLQSQRSCYVLLLFLFLNCLALRIAEAGLPDCDKLTTNNPSDCILHMVGLKMESPASCQLSRQESLCNGIADDTSYLQAVLKNCPLKGHGIIIKAGAICYSQPLVLTSNTMLFLEENSTIKAGQKWTADKQGNIRPFILAANVTNVSISGSGIFDGSGAQWWPSSRLENPPRPRLLVFESASAVRLDGNFTLLNSAFWTLLLGGRDFVVSGIRVRTPNFQIAPNTDGIDVAARNVHITGVDVANGDDSICIKSPSSNVLVEHSVVSAGNGLVVGTAGDGLGRDDQLLANVTNVTFRHCIANDTTFGCHVKYRGSQHGAVSGIRFENITITQSTEAAARRVAAGDWAGYSIGVHQYDQGLRASAGAALPSLSVVRIENITYKGIRADGLHGGQFRCSAFSPCRNIQLADVVLNVSIDGCSFEHTSGMAHNVSPHSCMPPTL